MGGYTVTQLSRFSGKTVLLTGGASGIGQAIAVRLAFEGASVVAFDVNEAGLRETVTKVAAAATAGGAARYLTGSVANEADVKRAIGDVIAKEGRLHSLINMAGILRASASTEVSLEQFHAVIDVNLIGTFLFCREALPHLLVTRGNIVNAASTAALFGHPYMAAYAASKGGVYALTRALAWEYLKQGVRVNAVAPGGILTPMMTGVRDSAADFDASLFQHMRRPDGGFGLPEQVAAVVAMLASDDGGYMTGEIVKVDGGVHS
jgi:NAD(P)-dependent dehydrogenase (short-subunit alcohol dehydrogenase family)